MGFYICIPILSLHLHTGNVLNFVTIINLVLFLMILPMVLVGFLDRAWWSSPACCGTMLHWLMLTPTGHGRWSCGQQMGSLQPLGGRWKVPPCGANLRCPECGTNTLTHYPLPPIAKMEILKMNYYLAWNLTVPQSSEAPKDGPCCHAHREAHHEAQFDPVPAAGPLPLLVVVSCWHSWHCGDH